MGRNYRKYVVTLAVGAVVLAATTLLTGPGAPRRARDPSRYRYVHCPDCLREKLYTPDALDVPCAYCDKRLVPTETSVGDRADRAGRYGTMYSLLGVEAVALMAVLLYLARPRPPGEDEFLYIACEKCTQKIRYLERQIGQTAMCPRCKSTFVCPEAEDGV